MTRIVKLTAIISAIALVMQGLFFSLSATEISKGINHPLGIWEKPRYERARLAAERGFIDQAIPDLQKITERYPDHVEAHAYLGWAYSQKGLISRAVEEFQEVIRIHPDLQNTPFDYPMTKDTPDAVREFVAEFEDFIDLIGDFPGAHEVMGFSSVQLGRLGDALTAYTRALNLKRVDAKETLSVIDQAIREYEDILQVKPNCVEAYIKLACVRWEKGMPDRSIADMQKAISLEPERLETHIYLACFYAHQRMLNEALQALGAAKKIRDNLLENLITQGEQSMSSCRYDTAITVARDAIKLSPGDKKAYWLLASAYSKKGEPEKAVEICKEVLCKYPDDIPMYAFLGWVYVQCDLFEEAKAIVERAMSIEPENADIQALTAFLYASQGQIPEAITTGNMALDTLSRKNETVNNYGWIRGKVPSIEQKFREVMDVIEIKPDYPEAYLCLGWLHAKNGEHEEATVALKKAVELMPSSYTAHRCLGNVYLQSGKIKEALDEYEKALFCRNEQG
ncbi:MAG: hypothetical protein B6D35_05020 [Candidatus Brocadia sp. UTAMX2]|jgi:tetratricopeptide (TPR) repeat protein|nr:MAG: hypothetical protein B6D35_05020 [Candidatus Brocadia sp. UTAMX2]